MRHYAVIAALLACLATPACQSAAQQRDALLLTRIDAAQTAAAKYILAHQQPDGSFHSQTYGFMKDGPSLTAHVAYSLFTQPSPAAEAVCDKSAQYLSTLINPDGTVKSDVDLIFPIYTSAQSIQILAKTPPSPGTLVAQSAWLKYLRSHQLTAANGWLPTDLEYGGWSYAITPPKKIKGQPRGPWDFSNLSATLYALNAMSDAKIPLTDSAYALALAFIERCQNYSDDPTQSDPQFDDGGFFFCPAEPLRNKAGPAGTDRLGRPRANSYGSMTTDGLRALLACNLPPTHPRVLAALHWLTKNFTVEHNPGQFPPATEDLRDATYYYYCYGLSQSLTHFPTRTIQTPAGTINWPTALAEELLRRQHPDGSWTNPSTDAREDDPLVATPFATMAMNICRRMIAEE